MEPAKQAAEYGGRWQA